MLAPGRTYDVAGFSFGSYVQVRLAQRIAVERMRYNERVQEYNTLRRQFPSNITAGIFSFAESPLFNAPPEAERVPRVDFGRQTPPATGGN